MTSTGKLSSTAADAPAGLSGALALAREGLAHARAALSNETAHALTESGLLDLQSGLAGVKRDADLLLACLCAEIAERSSADRGSGGLARKQGFTNPATMIAATTGGSRRDADRFIRAGRAIAEAEQQSQREREARASGGTAPEPEAPLFPAVAAALTDGRLSVDLGAQITRMLEAVRGAVPAEQIAFAEARLVEKAHGLSAEQFAPVVARWHYSLMERDAHERQQRQARERYVVIRDLPDGSVKLDGRLDPVTAAPLRAALEGMVKDSFRRRRDADPLAADSRSAGQIRADSLAILARHMLGCAQAPITHATTKVTVSIDLDQLREGTGSAPLDGTGSAIPAAQLRRIAVDAGYLPVVLGGEGQVLDVGRTKRRFTPAQCAALLTRDGGCAMCGAPPSHCEAHHIEWWQRDGGATDLSNGVMLCVACHHTVHRDGWDIDASDHDVWFRPPSHVDARRRPVPGGKARFGVTERERRQLDETGRPAPDRPQASTPIAQQPPPAPPAPPQIRPGAPPRAPSLTPPPALAPHGIRARATMGS